MLTCSDCRAENPEGALFCNACGRPLAAEGRASGEARKVVTVVFVDLVGFTAQAEQLDPEDVRRGGSTNDRAICSSHASSGRRRCTCCTRGSSARTAP